MTFNSLHSSAITPLIEGYKQFKVTYFEESKDYKHLVQEGQKPKVLIIACSDSRVDPAIVMNNTKPGELFVVRNVANLVPPFKHDPRHHGTSAALEFGVLALEVSDIIIFGHRHCGGIQALMETNGGNNNSDFIATWMEVAKPAKERVLKEHSQCSLQEQAHFCEKESLLVSLDNLTTFPWIQERVSNQQLSLHGWYFDLDSGNIEAYDSGEGTFVPLGN